MNCLLCSRPSLTPIESLTGSELRNLWATIGLEFSDRAWGGVKPADTISLVRCENCGFEFFDPSLAGNSEFYQELEHPNYYSTERQEFPRTVKFALAHRLHRVLDIGCGAGAFLDLAKQAGIETFGLELNPMAAAKARQKGHQIFETLLDGVDASYRGGFDLIALFQVLEHVSNPVDIIRQAIGFLAPGGFLAVAVPSETGVNRLAPLDPHQWPPHHISRWRLGNFDQLASACGLQLHSKGGDRLFGSEIEHKLILEQKLLAALGRRSLPGGSWGAQLVSFLYRKTGMKYCFSQSGSSIYAFFQKPVQ